VLRWVAVVWFAVWFPAYWHYWGWRNFLQLCDIAVFVAVAGYWLGSSELLSSQAVGFAVIALVWTADVGWRLAIGGHLIGGTEYLWDARYPLWLRLLSLYHIALPVLLLWSLRRTGYDARGWKLQAAIAAVAMIAAAALAPGLNYNMVERDPILARTWGPAPVHIAFIWLMLVAAVYYPTHLLLKKTCKSARG
jgi:hypothetical protein